MSMRSNMFSISCQLFTYVERIDKIQNEFDIIFQNTPEDSFSLKTIVRSLEGPKKVEVAPAEEVQTDLHPLLKKISEERWFPRDTTTINFQIVLQAIVNKISNTSKSLVKTLSTHLIDIDR